MVKTGGKLRLVDKHSEEVFTFGQVGKNAFDDDDLFEACHAGETRLETSAIPPVPIRSISSYLPHRSLGTPGSVLTSSLCSSKRNSTAPVHRP